MISDSNNIPGLDRLMAVTGQDTIERTYWLSQLAQPVKTSFPYDFSDHKGTRKIQEVTLHLAPGVLVRLLELSNGNDVKLNMILNAAAAALLYKYTGESDIITAAPIYRQRVESEFINTVLLLRNRLNGQQTFKELLRDVRQTITDAVTHQNFPVLLLPMPGLLNLRDFSGEFGECPLFDVVVLLQNIHDPRYIAHTGHNVTLVFHRTEHELEGVVQYNAQFYRRETMELVGRRFSRLLETLIFNVDQTLCSYDMLTEEERKIMLLDFNNTEMDYPKGQTLHGLFEEQAAKTPDRIALIARETFTARETRETHETFFVPPVRPIRLISLTYYQLNNQAGRLAVLLSAKGVAADSIVGVKIERSAAMITALLGILKAGGAYLPIDPGYPQERVNYMLQDSGAKLLAAANGLEGEKVRRWEGERYSKLAYILYTSGSTGRPKGVMVEHRNVVANVYAFYREFEITGESCGLQLASYTFDLFAEEVYPLLLRGGKIVIPNREEVANIQRLVALINRYGVTLVDTTPLLLNEFNKRAAEIFVGSGGRGMTFISGGDVLKPSYVDRLANVGRVYNTYGPTEATICASYYRYKPGENVDHIPIGKPIANYRIYIINVEGVLQPVGVPGELCIAGIGVARGYLNNPELTNQKFLEVQKPFFKKVSGPRRVYKTGDLARWLADGNIEFLGRIDRQVKIRGFRIELGEIENRLIMHAGINEAIVTAGDSNKEESFLCAYVVCAGSLGQSPTMVEELKDYLGRFLPVYMIPSCFMVIGKIPVTANGKIAMTALPKPAIMPVKEYIEPRDAVEEKIRNIWQILFARQGIGIDDDFFMLGGHSLKGIELVNALQEEFKVNVPLAEIFKTPSIREIAHYIKDRQSDNSLSEKHINDEQIVLLRKGSGGKNLFFIHAGSGEVDVYLELINRLPGSFHYWGIQAGRMAGFVPRNVTIPGLAREYIKKIRIIQPDGPYHIVGWCIGGDIGFEMLHQLEQEGTAPGFFSFINTWPPDSTYAAGTEPANLVEHLESLIKHLPFPGLIERIKPGVPLEQTWFSLMAALKEYEQNDIKFIETLKQVKERMPGNLKDLVPHFELQGARELLYYLLMALVLGNARDRYIPGGKIKAAVHFISAADQEIANREDWHRFCEKPVTFHKVSGDHFSLLEVPNVDILANIIAALLPNS